MVTVAAIRISRLIWFFNPMTISLAWSKPRPHREGLFIQTALPTDDFWPLWRSSKYKLAKQGVHLKRVDEGRGRSSWIVQRVLEIKEGKPRPKITVPIPLRETTNLLKYQIPIVTQVNAALLAHGKGLNLSDTGTGKTYMALANARELGLRPGIICPLAIIADWKKVCKIFKIKPLFIINWEGAKTDNFMYVHKTKDRYRKDGYNFHWLVPHQVNPLLIFDEIHKANSDYTQNLDLLLGALKYPVLGLSATLTETITKFKGVGKMMDLFEGADFEEWLKSRGMVKNKYGNWLSLSSKADMLFLHDFIFPEYGARISKDDIPGFPECQNIAQLCEIKNMKEQNAAHDKLIIQIDDLKKAHALNKLSGRQMQGELLVLNLRYRQLAESLKVNILIQLARDLVENGYSVPIFCNFSETIEALSIKLKTNCIIDGNTVGDIRQNNINAFQANKERYILCNIRAGGVGVSLHDLLGNHPRASLICPTYSAKDLYQVCGRVHRAGAKSKAMNYLIYAAGTIEEKKIYPSVMAKIKNIKMLNDGELGDTDFFE